MRTASFKVSKSLLMELFGFRNFTGSVFVDDYSLDVITVSVCGDDVRIPEGYGYPEYRAVCQKTGYSDIESHFEKIDEAISGK